MSWVEDDHGFVLYHTSDHLTIGAPTDGGGVVWHVSKGDNGIVISVLIDIPDLDRLVDRVGGEQLLRGLVPLNANTLALMCLNFHGAFNHV